MHRAIVLSVIAALSTASIALAQERAADAKAPASAPEAREFPKQKDTLPLCGMQAFWDPDQGLNPGFTVELFALLHADPKLRATIWMPSDWNDRARRLFQATNDLSLKDQGFRDRHGFKPAVLREFATYESRVGFIGVAGAEQQPSRVTLHHPNGIDVTVVRCDAVRGALAWVDGTPQEPVTAAPLGVGAAVLRMVDAVATARQPAAPAADEIRTACQRLQAEQLAAALDTFEQRVLLVRIGDPEIFLNLADCFASRNDRNRARFHYRRYLALAEKEHPRRSVAQAYIAETDRLHRRCLVTHRVVTPQLVRVGGQWVAQVQFTPEHFTTPCE